MVVEEEVIMAEIEIFLSLFSLIVGGKLLR